VCACMCGFDCAQGRMLSHLLQMCLFLEYSSYVMAWSLFRVIYGAPPRHVARWWCLAAGRRRPPRGRTTRTVGSPTSTNAPRPGRLRPPPPTPASSPRHSRHHHTGGTRLPGTTGTWRGGAATRTWTPSRTWSWSTCWPAPSSATPRGPSVEMMSRRSSHHYHHHYHHHHHHHHAGDIPRSARSNSARHTLNLAAYRYVVGDH